MSLLSRMFMTRGTGRSSVISSLMRHLSSDFNPPPQRPPRSPFPELPRRRFTMPFSENPRLRVHAVSIFSGDYSDDEDDDDDDDDDDGFDDDDDDDDDEIDPEKKEYARLVQEEEAKKQAKLAKWNAKPDPHPTVIDELGRSYGRGGRKTASARVYIQPGHGEVMVNRMPLIRYFIRESHRDSILAPLVATGTCGAFDLQITVAGGGKSGQAGAARHGLARALNAFNSELYRPPLKRLGFLTRDPRQVERKKIGLKKARKAPQWVKR